MTAGWPPEEAWEILDLDLRKEFTPFLVFSTSVVDFLLFKTSTFLPWEPSCEGHTPFPKMPCWNCGPGTGHRGGLGWGGGSGMQEADDTLDISCLGPQLIFG